MGGNVVSLHGTLVPQIATPDQALVEELERLLEAARSGEIVGFAGSYLHRDKLVSYSFAGLVAGCAMLGGLDCVKERVLRAVMARG